MKSLRIAAAVSLVLPFVVVPMEAAAQPIENPVVVMQHASRVAHRLGLAHAAPLPPPPPPPAWVAPIPGACITPNGSREFGVQRPGHIHGGVDLGGNVGVHYGDAIHAIHSGAAWHNKSEGDAGTYIYLDHGDGTYSAYFHMSAWAVPDGAHVEVGQVIGYVGQTGNALDPHLHFETHLGKWGTKVDPVKFLAQRGVDISC